MSIAQVDALFHHLCKRTSQFIEIASLVDHAVLEETLTDLNLIDARVLGSAFLRTHPFTRVEEGTASGADWLWLIGRPGRWLKVLVQAKKVLPKDRRCTGFRQKLPGGHGFQIDLLEQFARRTQSYPIYCVYNWSTDPASGLVGQTACALGKQDLDNMGCTVLPLETVRAYNRRWRHATQRDLLTFGHSLACMLRRMNEGDLAETCAMVLEEHLRMHRQHDAAPARMEHERDAQDIVPRACISDAVETLTIGSDAEGRPLAKWLLVLSSEPIPDEVSLEEYVRRGERRS